MATIGFIGCGNMGSAIIAQLAKQHEYKILIYDALQEVAQTVASTYGVTYKKYDEVVNESHIIILAVKPQVLPSLYDSLSHHSDKKYISIAAGVPLKILTKNLNTPHVVRFMPNMASVIGKSVTALSFEDSCDKDFVLMAKNIGNSFGEVHVIDESLFAPFIGISGSGIAMMFSLFHNMAQGAVYSGLSYHKALSIIVDTALSAAHLIQETDESPSELITKVCSPGGTTIEMMRALSGANFESAVMDGVISAAHKAIQLDKNN